MEDLEYIKFRTFEYMGLEHKIEIYNEERTKRIDTDDFQLTRIYLNNEEFNQLVDRLNEYKVFEWKEEYINPTILDGMEWELNYNINEKKNRIFGMNDYPTYWNKVNKLLKDSIAEARFKDMNK